METVRDKDRLCRLILKMYNVPDPASFHESISVEDYSSKLISNAFTHAFSDNGEDVGFISYYANDKKNKTAYIALLAVLPEYQGKKIAQTLMDQCIQKCTDLGMREIKLEVKEDNGRAIRFYKKYDFVISEKASNGSFYMIKNIQKNLNP